MVPSTHFLLYPTLPITDFQVYPPAQMHVDLTWAAAPKGQCPVGQRRNFPIRLSKGHQHPWGRCPTGLVKLFDLLNCKESVTMELTDRQQQTNTHVSRQKKDMTYYVVERNLKGQQPQEMSF